jgi:GAF domain-containing protein
MADFIVNTNQTKTQVYDDLHQQLVALFEGEEDLIANLSNCAAALHETFNWLWTGFYLVKNDVLVLGPFQGPVACSRIAFDKGVCGKSWSENKTLLVSDVSTFPGYISCSSKAMSEIVVPINVNGEVVAVLDVDAAYLSAFDESDKHGLEKIVKLLELIWF